MKANKIQVVEGTASFASKDTLAVLKKDGTKENMTFDKIIIAAGSVPAVPPIPGVKENANCVDSTGALSFEEIPKSLLVIGGGVIGIELATAYSKFGTEVTVVEAAPKLLPMMDGELTAQLRKLMEAKGVKIMTDAKVQSVEAAAVGAKVNVEIGGKVQPFAAEKVLVAVGRRTDTEALGLDAVGIANDRGRITVNDKMETNVPNVYAIGDCLGKVMLAHVASAQGEVAAENALGENAVYNGATNPSCVYTDPEFAGVGLTEEKAKEMGIAYQVGKFPLMANGKSLIMNGGVGSIKFIIGTEYKEVLGVHILGPRATDLIGECALAIGMEATVEDIIAAIHAHPTVTEDGQRKRLWQQRKEQFIFPINKNQQYKYEKKQKIKDKQKLDEHKCSLLRYTAAVSRICSRPSPLKREQDLARQNLLHNSFFCGCAEPIAASLLSCYFRHITIIKEDASADFVSVGAFSFAKFGDTKIKKPP